MCLKRDTVYVSRGTLLPEVTVYVQGGGRELADDAISEREKKRGGGTRYKLAIV